MTRPLILLCCLAAMLPAGSALARQSVPNEARQAAVAWLTEALNNPDDLPVVLAGLRSTNDPDLLPLFAHLTQSDDKQVRLVATAMIADLGGPEAIAALTERLETDPSMVIRGEALIHLARMDAIDNEAILRAAQLPDLGVQVIAARTLARRGKADLARDLLTKLADARDLDTAVFARMTLLDLGDDSQIPHLRKIIVDPDTPSDLLVRMLNQIRDEKIEKALPVARYLAKPEQLMLVRIRAYNAIAELTGNPAAELAEALTAADNLLLQLNLLRMLGEADNAQPHLTTFAKGDTSLATVARFELARQAQDAALAQRIQAAIDTGHPIVIEYVLNRFRQDIEAKTPAAQAYAKPLLTWLGDQELPANRLTTAHDRAAAAVELLANLGSQESVAGLAELLKGSSNSPRQQLIAGALYRSSNPIAVDLVRPLLDSAYSELYTYAALVAAKHKVDAAIPVLLKIQEQEDITRPDVLVLTNWYLIKLSKLPGPSVKALVESIE